MSGATAVVIGLAAAAATLCAHLLARFVAAKALLPDRPNARSSHRHATPRAGGFAIFGGFLVAMAIEVGLLSFSAVPAGYAPLLGCGIAAFAFGAIDDAKPLGARIKLGAQIAIAIAFVALVGPVTSIPLPALGDVLLGWSAFPLTVFWIVAFMNAFNFMDGVNGIAGACAIFALSAIAVATAGGGDFIWAPPAIFLACALFGFLPLNFPSGRLFMGDGGSQGVGFLIAALAVLTSSGGPAVSALFAPLIFMPFLFDVSFTLIHRIRRGRNILEGHNEHLYQLLVRLGNSHQSVTTIYMTLTVISTTAAIIANAVAPSLQFLAVIVLLAIFLPLGLIVYRRAERAGLLSTSAQLIGLPTASETAPFRAAAE